MHSNVGKCRLSCNGDSKTSYDVTDTKQTIITFKKRLTIVVTSLKLKSGILTNSNF